MSRYSEIDLSRVKTLSVSGRESKLDTAQMATPLPDDVDFRTFFERLPRTLAAADLHKLVDDLVAARQKKKPVLVMMGAHVIKVGLGPLLVDWMKRGLIQGIAMNGAGAIHDTELAFFGKTSEDVAHYLKDGRFGMSKETAALLNDTITSASASKLGFGEAIGRRIVEEQAEYGALSLFGQAYALGVPVTVHVAMGTDIVHQHPNANGAAIGETSLRDFRIFARLVQDLNQGGVTLLFGSTVILPEVFLKALTVARNVHGPVENFTTAVFDMIRHYRPKMNVLDRPTQDSGRSYQFTGHHEIMIPLLAAAWQSALSRHK